MTAKKILIAVALVLGATSASWAQAGYYGAPVGPGYGAPGDSFGGDYYAPQYGNGGYGGGYDGGYGGGYYDYAPGYTGWPGSPYDASPGRAVVSQPSPSGGVESQR